MIEQLIELLLCLSAAVAGTCAPSVIRRLIRRSRMSDDRAVSAHLHAVGSATRGGMIGSVGGLSKHRIECALVRLCTSGVVCRSGLSAGPPVFKLSEGAEVLIDT